MAAQKIEKIKVSTGIYWVNIPEADLRILCACPADTVKHLKKRGLVDVVERDGVRFESGPNAILLSDVLIQNGGLSNLAEFPLLQMLYLQGMILPNHPNNSGIKPLLIGSAAQLKAQLEYCYRGNYGLINREEIMATGVSDAIADQLWHTKIKFAFGQIKTSDNLVDQVVAHDYATELRNGATIRRLSPNVFEIAYEDEAVEIDLNLPPHTYYEPPYLMSYYQLNREYFSIVHTGEGDAWDMNRPCMASMIMFQGKVYLVDAGPELLHTMKALGITINEVAGIFNTHAHDDHFAGLTAFVRSDHRIRYFASAPVRASVQKKLCALLGMEEEAFHRFFEVQDLRLDTWNNIDGLEVMPSLSPHPVETNIFFFRAFGEDRYLSYAHLADVASFRVLEQNIFKDTQNTTLDKTLEKIKQDYLRPADLKKIDVGGGLIHGEALDFLEDKTPKILLAHISRALTDKEKQVGSAASFGSVDKLIATNHHFLRDFAQEYLQFYFPQVPQYDLNAMLNCPMVQFNAGDTLFRKGAAFTHIYLLLTGAVEQIYPDTEMENSLSAGSLIGFHVEERERVAKATCRAVCHLTALEIPVPLYLNLLQRYELTEPLNDLEDKIYFLSNTQLFGENISLPLYFKIAQKLHVDTFAAATELMLPATAPLYMLAQGSATLMREEALVVELREGDFFGLENAFAHLPYRDFRVQLSPGAVCYQIPQSVVWNMPIVYWKLREAAEQRN